MKRKPKSGRCTKRTRVSKDGIDECLCYITSNSSLNAYRWPLLFPCASKGLAGKKVEKSILVLDEIGNPSNKL